MPFTVFAANSKLSGGSLFVSVNSKDAAVYLKVFKQIANNDKNQKENFDWKNGINIKISVAEAGGLLRAVRNNGKYSFYHSFDNKVTTGTFNFYSVEGTKDGKPVTNQGFGLTIKKDDKEYKIGMKTDMAEAFAEYLVFCLQKIYSAMYAEDKKKAEEFAAKKAAEKPVEKPVEKPKTEKPTETTGEVTGDDADF